MILNAPMGTTFHKFVHFSSNSTAMCRVNFGTVEIIEHQLLPFEVLPRSPIVSHEECIKHEASSPPPVLRRILSVDCFEILRAVKEIRKTLSSPKREGKKSVKSESKRVEVQGTSDNTANTTQEMSSPLPFAHQMCEESTSPVSSLNCHEKHSLPKKLLTKKSRHGTLDNNDHVCSIPFKGTRATEFITASSTSHEETTQHQHEATSLQNHHIHHQLTTTPHPLAETGSTAYTDSPRMPLRKESFRDEEEEDEGDETVD